MHSNEGAWTRPRSSGPSDLISDSGMIGRQKPKKTQCNFLNIVRVCMCVRERERERERENYYIVLRCRNVSHINRIETGTALCDIRPVFYPEYCFSH